MPLLTLLMHVHEIMKLLRHEPCNHVYYNIYPGLLISHNGTLNEEAKAFRRYHHRNTT